MMKRLIYILSHLEEGLMVTMLAAMAIIMMVQVCCRYLFGMSLSWSEEITRYLFIWSAFVSISLCTKLTISIRIDLLIRSLSVRGRTLVKLFNLTVEALFFLYMIPYAWKYLQATIESGQVSPACGIPMYWVQSAPLVCFCLCVLRIIQRWGLQWYNLHHRQEYHNWAEVRAARAGVSKEPIGEGVADV